MGLLDKLIQEGAKIIEENVSPEDKEKVGEFLTNLKDGIGDLAGELKDKVGDINLEELKGALNAEKSSESSYDESYFEEDPTDTRTCKEKILEVLKSEFPEYEAREEVSPRELGGTGKFMDYSILVSKDGAPKLAIMLIGKTTASHREYRWSREFAESKGIPFINFIHFYPNKIDYITQRLHKYL